MGKPLWLERFAEMAREIEQEAQVAAAQAAPGSESDDAETVLRLSRGLRRRLEAWAKRT